MKDTIKPTRGAVAEGKVQVNWRLLVEVYQNCIDEAKALGFTSVPAFINNLMTRYFRGESIKRRDR